MNFKTAPQSVQEALSAKVGKQPSRATSARLLYGLVSNAVWVVARSVSIVRGTDVRFVNGARPMTARRHAINGLVITIHGIIVRKRYAALKQKLQYNTESHIGLTEDSTRALYTVLVVLAAGIGLDVRELITSRSHIRKYPTSTFNKLITATEIVSMLSSAAGITKELHRRKAEFDDLTEESEALLRYYAYEELVEDMSEEDARVLGQILSLAPPAQADAILRNAFRERRHQF